jgi:hypothetical protein
MIAVGVFESRTLGTTTTDAVFVRVSMIAAAPKMLDIPLFVSVSDVDNLNIRICSTKTTTFSVWCAGIAEAITTQPRNTGHISSLG